MLKKAASSVLATLRPSTYRGRRNGTYPLACDRSERVKRSLVCTSSALRSLRPCWTTFLNMLQAGWIAQSCYAGGRCFIVGLWAFLAPITLTAYAQDYPPDPARGKAVYARHCQSCHGDRGHGDGPAAASLKVSPADFHRVRSFLKSDEELLRTIEHGVVFSPMHSWRGQLTDGEMQDVLAYIRLLPQQSP